MAMSVNRVTVNAVSRTPFGRFNGALRKKSGPELGAFITNEIIKKAAIDESKVDAAYFGVGMISSGTISPGRQAVMLSSLPNTTPSFALDRACCSGMAAAGVGFKDIRGGFGEVIYCGGFDSLSKTPLLMPRRREQYLGTLEVDDPLLLRAPVGNSIAAYTSEEAAKVGIGRQEQDEWAIESHRRYFAADESSFFEFERTRLAVTNERGQEEIFEKDESPRRDSTIEKLSTLKTVNGSTTITAGNAPGLNDGAAGLLLSSDRSAATLGLPVLAYINDYVQISESPTSGTRTPAMAIEILLKRNNLRIDDLAVIEINEAFAATILVSTLRLAKDDPAAAAKLRERTNPHGGALAIGHPFGASGLRLIMTAISTLRQRGGGFGVAAICGGYGQGDAVLIEVPAA